ncbi:MAG TPA: HNH endonuclease [Actinomycetota bacterium]|nr:HNH endonuclease [Actinomycetota bacterium]
MGRSLVLNASYEPLGVVAVRRAVVLVLRDKAESVESNGAVFRSEHMTLQAPSVVRLRHYVRIPRRVHVAPNRKAVFLRDGHTCQYCGHPAENVDHVIPRSRGGPHSWDNVVAACRRCNGRKENRLPADVGLELKRSPAPPPDGFWLRLLVGRAEPEWLPYLAYANGHGNSNGNSNGTGATSIRAV